MLIRMSVHIGGYRNLEPWPAPGEVIEVPDHEGRDLIAAGYGVEADATEAADPGGSPGDVDEGQASAEDGDPSEAAEPVKPAAKRTKK